MKRLFIPTRGPADWRRLLANPAKHWKPGKSALEMAVCWEAAQTSKRGLPPEVAKAIDTVKRFSRARLIIGIPEHKVTMKGRGHPSQNDLWALLRAGDGLISMAIEAKAGEYLGQYVRDWLLGDGVKRGRATRLAAIQSQLGISDTDVSHIRYQLLHRTASALMEAERFGAHSAIILVQSFNHVADAQSWEDFKQFGELMGAKVEKGTLGESSRSTGVPLFIGWVASLPADCERLITAF